MTDRLTQAAQALRETTSGEESGAAHYSRSRVLGAVRQQKRRRVLSITFGVPVAAVLAGSVAWAASGHGLTQFVERVSAALFPESERRVPPAREVASNRMRPRSDPTATHELPAHDPAPFASAHAALPAPGSPAAPILSTQLKRSSPDGHRGGADDSMGDGEVTEHELLLYENAHRAHFVDRDWATALSAWEQYIRKAPGGRFAVEARYNRALCLVRLGNAEQARRALLPFAKGSYGNYRQREAQALIEHLEFTRP